MSVRNPASDGPGSPPRRRPTGAWAVVAVLLGLGIVVPLLVPLYDSETPDAVRLPVLLLVPVRADPGGLGCSPSSRSGSRCAPPSRTAPGSACRPSPTRTAVSGHEGRQRRRARHLPVLLPAGHRAGLPGRPVAPRRVPRQSRRVGSGRPRLRHVHHLVPARRRPLHGVHVHRGARDAVRRLGGRLLRGALHDRALPDHLHLHPAVLVGVAPARLRHARRLRPRALRLAAPGAGHRGHRHPRDDAVHRAAAHRHPGGPRGDGDRRWRATRRSWPRTCRCSSRSRCWPPTPTPRDCARRR